MFGDLGLSPGSSVTGAPHVLGATHVDDAVAIGAKNALTTGYNDAASRPSNGSAGTDLAGQTFSPGVYTASSSLLLSSGSVTLDAQGDPNAVFIFQIGSTLITGSNTRPGHQRRPGLQRLLAGRLLRDARDGHVFVGTIMARREHQRRPRPPRSTAGCWPRTAAVTLDTNTITNSNCASSASGSGGGTETTTPAEAATLAEAVALAQAIGAGVTAPKAVAPRPPIGSRNTGKRTRRRAARRPAKRVRPRRALPRSRGAFTG